MTQLRPSPVLPLFSFLGVRWTLEHSQTLISHPPYFFLGEFVSLDNGSLQWLEYLAPGTRAHQGTGFFAHSGGESERRLRLYLLTLHL